MAEHEPHDCNGSEQHQDPAAEPPRYWLNESEPLRKRVSSSFEKGPRWPQSFKESMELYSRSPSISRMQSCEGEVHHVEDADYLNVRTTNGNGIDAGLTEPLLNKTKSTDLESCEARDWTHGDGVKIKPNGVLATDDEPVLFSHHEEVLPPGSSFLQATLNGMNILAGVGILSTPYAISQGGWFGLVFLLAFAGICLYTGILLRRCLDLDAAIVTYPDVGQAAFGKRGRYVVSVLLYMELYCVCVEFLILEGDNLANLFPFHGISVAGFRFTSHQTFVIFSAFCMLPTVWLRDLSLLSYISAGGVVASSTVVLTVGYVGAFEGVGFHHSGKFLDISGLPVAMGVYAFCYCGHAVFPSIYGSMKEKESFSKVLLVCFVSVTLIYGGIGVIGYLMFGDDLESQVTLNLPQTVLASRVAIWITLVNPFAKYALTISPLAGALEELLPYPVRSREFVFWGTGIRTLLVVSTVSVALLVPFFGYMMAFIGSLLSISVAILIPCACYLKIFCRRKAISSGEVTANIIFIFIGIITASVGTYSSIKGIIGSFSNGRK